MYLYFEFCTFKILSQNTLQKVNLMRSLMADWYRWRYSPGWRNNSRSFFHPGAAGWIFLTLFFRLTELYILPKSVLCSNVLCTSCDIVTLRCTGLVLVVHDRLYCILYFIVMYSMYFGQSILNTFTIKYFKIPFYIHFKGCILQSILNTLFKVFSPSLYSEYEVYLLNYTIKI